MAKDGQQARGIQSIEVGGRILQVLSDTVKPMNLREIASKADITSAQAHAYLVSFKRIGMVVQRFESGRYLLGPLALKLGLSRLGTLPIYQRTQALLKDLSLRLNVMCVLSVWGPRGPTAVMVVQAQDKRSDINIRMGTRFSVLASATGRVFGAFCEHPAVEEHLQAELTSGQLSKKATADRDQKYREMILQVRKQGFTTISGAWIPDIDAIAVPIFDERHQFTGSLTCIGHSDTLDTAPDGKTVNAVLAAIDQFAFGLARSAQLAS